MNNIALFVVGALLCALWQIPILTAAGWLTTRLLRRMGPATEHGVWAGIMVLCVTIPLLPPRSTGVRSVAVTATETHETRAVVIQARQGVWPAGPIPMPLVVMEVLVGLWALTVAFGASRLIVGLGRTRRLLAYAEPCAPNDDVHRVWHDCCVLMGLRGGHLLVSRDLSGPVTLTFDHDALVLPSGFSEQLGLEEMRAAVLHECAHMRRGDFRNNLLYQVLALPVQFHPAIWFLKQQLAATREMACDAAVVAATGNGLAYGSALLRLAQWMRSRSQAAPTHAVGIFDANVLEERIMRLRSAGPMLPRCFRLALLGLGACTLAIGVAGAMSSSVAVAPQASVRGSKPAVAPQIYTIGKGATAPQLIFQVDPQYTEAARAAKVNGNCVIAAVVDPEGIPQDVHVTKGLRSDLDANAAAAVRQYRFRPGLHEGKPVPVQLSVAVNFQIF